MLQVFIRQRIYIHHGSYLPNALPQAEMFTFKKWVGHFMLLMVKEQMEMTSEFKGKWQAWQRTRNYLLTELGQEFRVPHAKFKASLRTFTCPLKLLWWWLVINYMSPSGNLLYLDKSWGTQKMIPRLCLCLTMSPSGFSPVPEPWCPFLPKIDLRPSSASELCTPPSHKWCTKGSHPIPEQWTCISVHRGGWQRKLPCLLDL